MAANSTEETIASFELFPHSDALARNNSTHFNDL